MSSVNSVASSVSSLESSTSPIPASGGSARPTNPPESNLDYEDVDDAYADESFAIEDPVVELDFQDRGKETEIKSNTDDAQNDENYDDEEFEDSDLSIEKRDTGQVNRSGQAEQSAEYSDAFEYSEDFVDGGPETFPATSDTTHDTIQPKVCEQQDGLVTTNLQRTEHGVQHPGNDFNTLTNAWARTKLHCLTLQQRKPNTNDIKQCILDPSAKRLEDAFLPLLRQLRKRRPSERKPHIHSRHLWPQLVPTPLVDRVHVHKQLALSSQPPASSVETAHRTNPRSMSTFCSVKTADLQGKLATQRLSDLCARWETSSDHALSAATSEFLASVLAKQRQALRPGPSDSVLGALLTHATAMDRAVETATLAISDSRELLDRAHAVLHAPDAHTCTCCP